jgi:hypothetical protein
LEPRSARLLHSQLKTAETRDLLAPVYGWFTEGFDTANLKEANAPTLEVGSRRSAVAWAFGITPIPLDTRQPKGSEDAARRVGLNAFLLMAVPPYVKNWL